MGEDEKPPSAGAPASADKTKEKPLWALDSQEQRLLWITFVGGVASIVVSAAILGVSIALARWLVTSHPSTPIWVDLVILLVSGSALAAVLIIRWRLTSGLWLRLIILAFFLCFITVILTWIGVAAGVK
jgi:hypothetical protein